VIAVAVFVALLGTGTPAAHGNAPADEYFGRFKMSPLSIRSRLDSLARRYHERSIDDADLLHDAGLAEVSIRAWREGYPSDAWLPSTAFRLEQLYQAVQTETARVRAHDMLLFVVRYFGSTSYGRISRVRLARGFPPLHAEAAAHATPNPYSR
jgi:hypothetical protein